MLNKEKFANELFDLLFDGDGCEFVQTRVLKRYCGDLECMDCRVKFKEWLNKEYREDKKMELKDTVELMISEEFDERFAAEYYQTKIRYNKLDNFIVKYMAGLLDEEPETPVELLKSQLHVMDEYLRCLEARAMLEGIELDEKFYGV